MPSLLKIPLTESQKNLLQRKEITTMVEPEVKRALSAISSEGTTYSLHLNPGDLDDLIGMICFVANHEAYDSKLVRELDLLAVHLEQFLDKK